MLNISIFSQKKARFNLSILKNGKAKAIRLSTLESICQVLDCQPGDLMEYTLDENLPCED